jgi:hypothetical protein
MSYSSTRDNEQLRIYDHAIGDFSVRYNLSGGPSNGPRRTVFLFPGGMASRLKRAETPYVDGMPTTQPFHYKTVWLNSSTLLGEVLNLRMYKVGGKHHDKDDRIIVADGSIDLLGFNPYDGFTAQCAVHGIDYFVFGWDWRRRIDHIGKFFIDKFLPYFQQQVKNQCNNADPLSAFLIVGHSAGGMVVNWILRKHDPNKLNLLRAITVATPFYGYAAQEHRWFEGEPYFNFLGKDKIIKVLASMPSCYSFQFLPYGTFAEILPGLQSDPEPSYRLGVYPSMDQKDPTVRADPYNPQTNGSKHRYPTASATGFDMQELIKAKAIVKLLASPLTPATLEAKFVNIRGDVGGASTVGSIKWDWVPSTSSSPITDDSPRVRGDTVQPAWTARHVGLATNIPNNVLTVTGSDVNHVFTLNSPRTLAKLLPFL